MGLFKATARITSVFPTRFININIEKKMAKPVYILFLDVYLREVETMAVSTEMWSLNLIEMSS